MHEPRPLHRHPWILGVMLLALVAPGSAHAQPAPPHPFLVKHCLDCHDAESKKGGLDLGELRLDLADRKAMAKWVAIHDRVARGEMPPKRKVPDAEKAAYLAGLAAELTKADAARKGAVLRRLNRHEYEHTLHDLLGIDVELKGLLPEDGKAHGFDNVGEGLNLSSVHLERYLSAADRALGAAVRKGPAPERKTYTLDFHSGRNEKVIGVHWLKRPDGAVVFFNRGSYPTIVPDGFRAPVEGLYRIRITGYAYQSEAPVAFAAYGGNPFGVGALDLLGFYELPPGKPSVVEVTTRLKFQDALRLVPQGISTFYPDFKKTGPEGHRGPGLAVQSVVVEGPLFADWPGVGHRRLFAGVPEQLAPRPKFGKPKDRYDLVPAQPAADARRLLEAFLPLAFRRDVGKERAAPYLKLFEEEAKAGANYEDAMKAASSAVLTSRDFLFRVEKPGPLDDFALASRLSYFLWSSMPDEPLLAVAARGKLRASLREQTERMLKDPKAARFTKHFVGQWLNLRDIDFTNPDRQLYPEFDEMLHEAMVRETEGFFDEVLSKDLPLHSFLDSDWTILNERLAEHYGIAGVKGVGFRKVTLPPDSHRGGVLTHASVLRVSANGTTTSPVVRGAWVLERILADPPAPPPPGIPGVEPDIRGAVTLREQLDKHRNLASCAGCHNKIDPPGFALENYDVIGGWRANYRSLGKNFPSPPLPATKGTRVPWRVGPKVDASGVADGQEFRDLEGYKKILLADKKRFARALAEKVATYASGRGLGFSDRPALDAVVEAAARKDYGFRELIHAVVQSEIFLTK